MKKCFKCNANKPDGEFRPTRNQCRACESRAAAARKSAPARPKSPSWANTIAALDEIYSEDVKEREVEPEILVTKVEELSPVEEHRLKVKNAELVRQVKSLTEALSNAQMYADLARQAAEAAEAVEPITIREHTSGLREGAVQVLCSDLHIEEAVRPEQVAGRNEYNLEISKRRCERLFQGTRWGIEFNRQAYKIRDLIFWLGGDLITGYLHDDNVESNLLSPVEAIAEMYGRLVGGFDYLLEDDELERIVVPMSDGNHGRLSKFTRSATRIENSIEWLLYKMVADHYKDEPRIECILPQGAHTYYDVYGKTIHYHHGDETKYGGGVGGITIPIYKSMARWETMRHADLTCLGHWHQRTNLHDLIINGSLIGPSAYSMTIGARYEPPMQDLSVLDAKRWRGPSMPIWVDD